jgi:hypothetical protein
MADILHVRHEVRDAAKALVLASFREPSDRRDGSFEHIWLASLNEALNFLREPGLTKTLSFIDDELAYAREDCLAFEQIMRFFSDNPSAQVAMPINFPEGSPARKVLYEFLREVEHDQNPPKGLKRAVAEMEFSNCQRNFERLMAAKDAIQRALASEHR